MDVAPRRDVVSAWKIIEAYHRPLVV